MTPQNKAASASSTSVESLEMVEQRLRSTQEWDMVADLVHGKDFDSLPSAISKNFAMCFLI